MSWNIGCRQGRRISGKEHALALKSGALGLFETQFRLSPSGNKLAVLFKLFQFYRYPCS